jgi:co-chaperonin GroES (HSP10)
MRAVNFYVLVKRHKIESKNIGGLEITDNLDSDNRYLKADVVSVGDKVKDVIKEGEVVYYDRHSGHVIDYNGESYQVITAGDIVLVE